MITDGGTPFGFLALLALVLGTPVVVTAIGVALFLKRRDFANLVALLIGHENSVFHGKTTFRVS